MTTPISPPPVQGGARDELPAYVANGVVGLRVREMPLGAGLTLISGYSGEHPQRRIEAIAVAPYPVTGDIQLAGVWLSDAPHAVTIIDQVYEFAIGELVSRFEFEAETAASILDYRTRSISGAASNARLRGRRGLQFPWESAPSSGQESAPLPGSASWHEDHVSLDVARAFAFHADVTGDLEYLHESAWPILSGVANWITSRVTKTARGYEIRAAMGIAERETEVDNAAFTNMAAVVVLRDAIRAAERLGRAVNPEWIEIAEAIALPIEDGAIVSHDGFKPDEDKGGTPDPLMGIFPLGFGMDPGVESATLKLYLGLRDGYIGSPMLSALYGVWAAYAGDRALSAQLMDEGYGRFCVGRFMQTLEYRPDVFPDQPRAGPFFANLGGFLIGLLAGFPGLLPGPGDVQGWMKREVVLPEGWTGIEVERVWIHGRPYKLAAQQGAERAQLTPA